MNASFRLSVIIPCYNAADTLARAVQSIVAQENYGIEIVIVDDRSTDDSETVGRSLAQGIPGVSFLQQPENTGQASARNEGLRRASGRYVCFLDADDEYAPRFFSTVLPILEKQSELAWVSTGMELVNCEREVHPVQLQAAVGSSPSNLLIRKAAADLIGGFPESPAFRGKSGGEDIMFRTALQRFFRGTHIPDRFLRYWLRPDNHMHRFLDNSRVENGRLVFLRRPTDETDRDVAIAQRLYQERVNERLGVVKSLTEFELPKSAATPIEAIAVFDKLCTAFSDVHGSLDPQEGFALYHFAKEGPGRGAIVEIGSLCGLSTCWLAAGTRAAGREKIVAVDHFQGSPEHQKDGSHPLPAITQSGTTLPTFIANLKRQGLREWIDVRVGKSADIGAAWKEPLRLLFLDGDHSYEAVRADFETWSKHLIPAGLIAFHNVGTSPGATQLYQELIASQFWKETAKAGTVCLVARK